MSESNIALSIYIPRVLKFHTVDSIASICFNARIGIVHRVDFVAIENAQYYMSAFVHIKELNNYSYLVSGILTHFDEGKGYRFRVSPDEFWILLKAKNVVPDTHLNMHQLAENHRLLEELVTSQAEEMTRMKDDIDRLQETIYQLLAVIPGLESSQIYQYFNFMKYGKFYDKGWLYGNEGDVKAGCQEEDEEDSEDEYADMPELISPSDEEDDEEDYEVTTPRFMGRNLAMEFLDSP